MSTRHEGGALFMTHHAPMGAWSSLTFGKPGGGVGIETEALGVQPCGDFIVARSHGKGRTTAFPFFAASESDDYEGRMAGDLRSRAGAAWGAMDPPAITRSLGPAVDEFAGADMRLRVISPRGFLELPDDGETHPDAVFPGLLLEFEVDNEDSDEEATGFLGFAHKAGGRMRPLDWCDPELAGIALRNNWALAARPAEGAFTVRSGSVLPFVESGSPVIHAGGIEGGIGFRIPPRTKRTLQAVFGFFRDGRSAVQGAVASYAYARHFDSVEAVCRHGLDGAASLRASASEREEQWKRLIPDPLERALMAQAAQGYYANSSLLRDANGALHWSVCEGQFAWRNTLDLAVDQLPFELAQHPSVARNVIEGFIRRYSYTDSLTFEQDTEPTRPGGISFTHDQGNYTSYSPEGFSGYEAPDRCGVYAYMTTEQLLNGVFCSAAVAISGGDPAWAARHGELARRLLSSIENREHFEPSLRDGILRGQSSRAGRGAEVTTYDALDHALQKSRGSIYIVVKTWCAGLLLENWLSLCGDAQGADRAKALADRVARTLARAFDKEKTAFPANLLEEGESLVLAALDPLAVPLSCGLASALKRYPEVLNLLHSHARSCLQTGVCVEPGNGGIRLSSTSSNSWPSKLALCMATLEWLEEIHASRGNIRATPVLAQWMQGFASDTTLADQIDVSSSKVLGGVYYPRLVTLWTLYASGERLSARA